MKKQKRPNKLVCLFSNVKLPWILIIVSFLLGVAATYLELESVTLTANIIDSSQTIKTEKLIRYVLYILLTGITTVSSDYINGLYTQKVNLGVRIKLWNKVMRLPTRYYDGESGELLVSRVTTDAQEASSYFSLISTFVIAVYSAVLSMINMYKINAEMANYMLIIIPVTALLSFLIGQYTYKVGSKTRNTFAATTGYLAERVRNFWLIKASVREKSEVRRSKDKFQSQFKADMMNTFANAMQTITIILTGVLMMIMVFVVGSKKVANNELTTGLVVAFYTLSSMAAVRFIQLLFTYTNFRKVSGSVEKIVSVLDADEETTYGIELDVFDADIVLKDISFGYKTDMPILKGIDYVIPKNKITAIIGANGAGKSTIFKLLERMYDVDTGEILFGETNIKEFNLTSWRKSFALVAQDRPLISGTVRENIVYGVERDVSDKELIEVAKMASVYDFVKDLPEGLDSEVGPGGSNFSGGQRQCIAIARAIMRNPDYLLLDEATSNLDSMCERSVSDAIKNLMSGRTTLMIAHNPSAIRNADNVIILDDGKIVQAGSPQQLLKTSQIFRNFVSIEHTEA